MWLCATRLTVSNLTHAWNCHVLCVGEDRKEGCGPAVEPSKVREDGGHGQPDVPERGVCSAQPAISLYFRIHLRQFTFLSFFPSVASHSVTNLFWNIYYCVQVVTQSSSLLPTQISFIIGRDPRSSDSFRGSRNFVVFFIVRQITHDFSDFPSTKFYDISTQQRRSVRRWKCLERNVENFTIRGRFSKKGKNCLKTQVLRLQTVITPQWS